MSDSYGYFHRAPSLPVNQTVTASPFVYSNNTMQAQQVSITGGVVSLIEIDAGLGYVAQVGLLGTFLVLPQQSIKVTYVVTPPIMNVVTL